MYTLIAVALLSTAFVIPLKGQALEQVFSCEDPVDYVLASLSEWNVYHLLTVFFDSDSQSERIGSQYDFLGTNLSVSIQKSFDMDNFMGNFYSNPINSYFVEKNVALVVPKSTESALEIFNRLGMDESLGNGTDDIKPAVIINWPNVCETSDCLPQELARESLTYLPSMVNDIYFLQCTANGTSSARNSFWDVYSFYSVGRNKSSFEVRKFKLDDMNNYYEIKQNFGGAELFSAIPDKVQREEMEYDQTTGKVTGGLAGNVSAYMQDALNFTMTYKKTDAWIKLVGTTWHGMARQLLDDEIDVAVIKTTYLPSRNEKFTLLVPHFSEGIQAFFQQPPASSIRNIFAEPFNRDLWGTLIAVWFLVGLSTILATKIKTMYDQRDEADEEISKDTLLWAIAFTCQQGWHQDPQSVSMKLIFLCGSVLGLIVYVAYSAALVSALSTEVVPIKTFEDLLQKGFAFTPELESQTIDAILDGRKGVLVGDEFDSNDVAILKQRIRKIRNNKEGVALVYNSRNAFMSFSGIFYSEAKLHFNQSEGDLCTKISQVRVSKVPFRSGMLVKKMSPYKEFFNVRLVQMYEDGIMLRFQQNYKMDFLGACDSQRNKKTDIGLELADLFTSYCILLSGYALSFTIFLMEWLYHKKRISNVVYDDSKPDVVTSVGFY